MEFRRLSDKKMVNIIPYALEFLAENPDHTIYVGTDSQNIGKHTVYATVVVFHHPNRGGHVLYSKISIPRINDRYTKLWKEVELSIEAANMFNGLGLPHVDCIDLDLNPDPRYKSNQVLIAALGYVKSLGYNVRVKPNATIASTVADAIFR
jgi:predicted RNase H-related nuclease YkuK (DUF458 family)